MRGLIHTDFTVITRLTKRSVNHPNNQQCAPLLDCENAVSMIFHFTLNL